MVDRIHVWHYVINEEGQPIEGADIRLYLSDDLTTEANIYVNENSASYTTCSSADIKTDVNGFFEFWMAGNWEAGGYDFSQYFRLEWYRPGIKSGYINNFNPWPNIFTWENTPSGGDVNYYNKFVSNYLVNKWLTHLNETTIPSASIHNIFPIDYSSGCNNDDYNKVVSNEFIRDILEKCSLYDSISLSGGSFFPTGSEIIEYTEVVPSGSWVSIPSGSWMASASPSGYYKDFITSVATSASYVFLVNNDTYEEITPTKVYFITSGSGSTRILINNIYNTIRVSIDGKK